MQTIHQNIMENFEKLVAKKLSGEATAEEAAALEKLLKEDEKKRLHYQQMEKLSRWGKDRAQKKEGDAASPSRFSSHGSAEDDAKGKKTALYFVFGLVVVVGGMLGYYFWQGGAPETAALPPYSIEKYAAPGQKPIIKLYDGSVAKLNSGSKLELPSRFGGGVRQVRLEGGALFEATPNYLLPFVVETENARVFTSGASFHISSYPSEGQTVASVLTGSVKVVARQTPSDTLELQMGEAASFDAGQGVLKRERFQPASMAWIDGKLLFKESSWRDVAAQLHRWYGVDFTFERDTSPAVRFTGEFKGMTLEEVLADLRGQHSFSFNFQSDSLVVIR